MRKAFAISMLLGILLAQEACFCKQVDSATQGKETHAIEGLSFTSVESETLFAAINDRSVYFLLFVPTGHSLTAAVNQQISAHKSRKRLEVGGVKIFLVQYQFGRTDDQLKIIRELLPEISLPKDPFLYRMKGNQVSSKSWLTGKETILDLVNRLPPSDM